MSEQAPQAPTPAPTPAPSENGPERARPSLKGIDWHDVRQKTISGVFAAAIIGGVAALATYAWNNLSQGGFVRLMGGVTQADLQSAVERVATQAVTNIAVPVQHAIIAFDGPCPPGWILAKEAVGSALVGVGATIWNETGWPVGNVYVRQLTGTIADDILLSDPKKPSPVPKIVPMPPLAPGDYAEPVTRYKSGVRTAIMPLFLPVSYCRKQ